MWSWLCWPPHAEPGPAPFRSLPCCPWLSSRLNSCSPGNAAGKKPKRVNKDFCNPQNTYLLQDNRYPADACMLRQPPAPATRIQRCLCRGQTYLRPCHGMLTKTLPSLALVSHWAWHKPLPVGRVPCEQMKSSAAVPGIWPTSSQEQQHWGRRHCTCELSVPTRSANNFRLRLISAGPNG